MNTVTDTSNVYPSVASHLVWRAARTLFTSQVGALQAYEHTRHSRRLLSSFAISKQKHNPDNVLYSGLCFCLIDPASVTPATLRTIRFLITSVGYHSAKIGAAKVLKVSFCLECNNIVSERFPDNRQNIGSGSDFSVRRYPYISL